MQRRKLQRKKQQRRKPKKNSQKTLTAAQRRLKARAVVKARREKLHALASKLANAAKG